MSDVRDTRSVDRPLLVDYNTGSIELLEPLRRSGAPALRASLRFGDFRFTGNGPDGLALIGVERKTVSEILGAVSDSRFRGWQLPGMLKAYDYRYLVVEGWTCIEPGSGILRVGNGDASAAFKYDRNRHLYANYKKFLLTMTNKAGFRIEHTSGMQETVSYLHALYSWWGKRWADHKSAYCVRESEPDSAILDERTLERQCYAQFPGVGWERSRRVAQHFPSIDVAACAGVVEWQRALGVEKGEKSAKRIVHWLRGRHRAALTKGKT